MLTNEQLKMLRIKLDLVQTDVAVVYQCSKQYVSNIENGIEKFYTEEKYKNYIDAIYKAKMLKQKGQLPKYKEGEFEKPNSKKK